MALILYTEAGLAAFARHHHTNRRVTLSPVLGTVYDLPPSEYWDAGWTPSEGGRCARGGAVNARAAINIARFAVGLSVPPASTLSEPPNVDHYEDPWDITDVWIEATGEEEQSCVAYFDHNPDCGELNPRLRCISVTEGDDTLHISAEMAAILLGDWRDISRLETVYSDRVNE
jgi:hypothetical protein